MIVSSESVVAHLRQVRSESDLRQDGVAVYYYFDTSDVRQAIAGVHAYSESAEVTANAPFSTQHALIWALLTSGDLGPVRLLPPHQAELLTLLQYHLYIDDDSQHQHYVTTFLHFVNGVLAHTHAPDERLVIRFKAQEALWAPWRSRLATLVDAKILDVESIRQDYSTLIQTPAFHRLYSALSEHRPLKSMNNFADAAALSSLLDSARRFTAGDARELPFFYSSSTLFDDVLRQTGYRDDLVVRHRDSDIDLLIPFDYLIVRALFHSNQAAGRTSELTAGAEALAEVFADTPTATDLRVLALNGGFAASIDDVVQQLFNQRIFEPSTRRLQLGDDEFPVLRLEDDEQRHWADDRVHDVMARLRRNTKEFRALREIWMDVSSALGVYALQIQKVPPGSDPLSTDGLMRFAFPTNTEPLIRDLLLKLQSHNQIDLDEIAVQIYRVLRDPQPASPIFTAVAALLWVLQLNNHLLALLGDGRLRHHSLAVLRAATLLRVKAPAAVVEGIAEELEREYETAADQRRRAELAIGIAYIEYRLAQGHGFVAGWQRSTSDGPMDAAAARHIRKAIEHSRAATLFAGFSLGLQAFSSNVYLFYLVEEASAEEGALRQAASKLGTFRGNRSVWWYGFDDTLARYFFLRYQRAATVESRTRLLQWSLDAITEAHSVAPDDDVVTPFYSHVQLEYDAHRSAIERPDKM